MLHVVAALLISTFVIILYISRHHQKKNPNKLYVCFFHPNCDAGGGGERVLWAAIEALQLKYDNIECAVYSVPGLNVENLQKSVYTKFKIKIKSQVKLIPLKLHFLLNKKYYPFFTVLCQNFMSIFVGLEGLLKLTPDVFIDTTGFPVTAFCLALFSRNTRKAAYVHYPIISSDMLTRVESTPYKPAFIKILYYKFLMFLYGVVGNFSFDCVMVNSTWTENHILALWGNSNSTWILYPPCATDEFSTLPPTRGDHERFVVASLAQFRPEKNLELQIRAMGELLAFDSLPSKEIKLILVGGVRNSEDRALVDKLADFAAEIGVASNVEFRQNVSFDELKQILSGCSIGVHSMVDEHFGIGIVECMAAGLVMVAHNSGGPKLDILADEGVGFRAETAGEYAERMMWIMSQTEGDLNEIRRRARLWVIDNFSDRIFRNSFTQIFDSTLLIP